MDRYSVRLATAAALAANTRTGNVLEANANGALTVDGQSASLGDRVLVKNESTASKNGIYVVTSAGGTGAKWKLVRVIDMNTSARVVGTTTYVQEGTANAESLWACTNTGAVTLNSTSLVFEKLVDTSGGAAGQAFPPSADLAMGTHKLTGLGDPSSAQDAATMAFVGVALPLLAPMGLRIISNATTPNTKVDYSVRQAVLTNETGQKAFTGSGTINTGVVGANGIDAGTQAANTLYYLWLIGKADGTFAGLLSTSSTAPTMPTGYTYKFLASWATSDASTHFVPFSQSGNILAYDKWITVVNGFVNGVNTLVDFTSALSYPLLSPALCRRVGILHQSSGFPMNVAYGRADTLGGPGSTPLESYIAVGRDSCIPGWVNTDASGRIRYFNDTGGGAGSFMFLSACQIEWF